MSDLNKEAILQKYLIDSNEALDLKLVRSQNEAIEDETVFKPDMSHQVFGDMEQIFGYAGLQIKLYYTACRLSTYLSYSYKEKVDPAKFEGVKPDEIIKPIAEKIPPGYTTNLDNFIASLEKDGNFKPFGDMKHRFTKESDEGEVKVFEIYSHDISPSGFKDYHERLQTFLLWYIDASSYIDSDDDKWRFFLVYEKYLVDGTPQYAIAGYATVYEYYAYPSNTRPRISQMLVFPPFQGAGLGTELLEVIYNHYKTDPKVLDITVEDPSDNFQRLRDFVDSRNCLGLKCFSTTKLIDGFTKEMQIEAQTKLKLSKPQIRRVYEILRLRVTDRNNREEYRLYRLAVKNRLNVQYKKEDNYLKKLSKFLSPEELAASMGITNKEQRLDNLNNLYKQLEDQYTKIIEKLI